MGMMLELQEGDDKVVAKWAAACAERVLPYFSKARPGDMRPKDAIEAVQAWVAGRMPADKVRTAAFGAHGAARMAPERSAAQFAARAAAHAAGVVSAIDHAAAAGDYAKKAALAAAGGAAAEEEAAAQQEALPKRLYPLLHKSLSNNEK